MADWLGVNSSHIDSVCGEGSSGSGALADALNATGYWGHTVAHLPHWFIIDFVTHKEVQKVRGRNKQSGIEPKSVNIYVSNDKENWGTPVASTITTWEDTADWVEIDTVDKIGRYLKVEITETGALDWLFWGGAPGNWFEIFDVYVEEPLIGTITAQSAVSGSISGIWTISSTITTTSAATGLLKVARKLVGTAIVGSSSVTGTLKVTREVIGTTIASTSSVTGIINVIRELVGTITCSSSTTGTILNLKSITGIVEPTSTASGILKCSRTLTGTIAGQSTISGLLEEHQWFIGGANWYNCCPECCQWYIKSHQRAY